MITRVKYFADDMHNSSLRCSPLGAARQTAAAKDSKTHAQVTILCSISTNYAVDIYIVIVDYCRKVTVKPIVHWHYEISVGVICAVAFVYFRTRK